MDAPAAPAKDAVYDPMTDPVRRAKSNDPGWKYAYWKIVGNRDLVVCNLCNAELKGGIKRLKEHLAGGYADVRVCANTTTLIQKEMGEYLKNNRRRRPIYIEDDKELDLEVMENPVESSSSQIVKPSSGTASKRRRAAFQFKIPAPKETNYVAAMVRKMPEQVSDQRCSGSYQSTMQASTKTLEDRNYVNMQWAYWFYECGIPINAANSRQFQIACEATAQFGSGYKPPSTHELREPLLRDCLKETGTLREEHERAWKQYGCTLMSNGWSDRRGRHLINFLVNSPEGTYFLESVDASSEQHDAIMIANLLEERINAIGIDKVVQVVTDNGANYKAAGALLMARIPTLFWTPCAAHCLDLMLEDIGKLKEFQVTIQRARCITTFIYRHGRLLNAMRHATGGMGLVRHAATRFATSFLTLRRLHKHKDALMRLFASDAWTAMKRLSTTEAGLKVKKTVLAEDFWTSVEDCLRASDPLLTVLRMVHGDEKPAMPEVAALVNHAKAKIKQSFATQNKARLLKIIIDIIEKRWVKQIDHPLYGAALYLNPGKMFAIQKSQDDTYIGELRGAFTQVLERMVQDTALRNKIDEQALLYEEAKGIIFSNKLAIDNIDKRSPLDWWRSYGGRAIELQRFAKRITSLCASSSDCELNWSTFEFIHTKKRNRFQHKRLNDLVTVSYNRKMKTRFALKREKSGKSVTHDPLVYDDFDWDNEWVDALATPPEGARGCKDDISWDDIDRAIGASRSLQGHNLPRQANVTLTYQRRRKGPVSVEENTSNLEGTEEHEDPLDDVDVSDCEEASNAEDGEELVATNEDDFSDGY